MKKHLRNLLGLCLACALCQPAIAQCGGGGGGSTSTATAASTTSSFASFNSNSQNSLDNLFSQVRLSQSYTNTTQSFYASTDGSPYMYDEFQNATLVFNNDIELNDVKVNYDGYTGDIIAVNEEDEKIALDPKYYKKVLVETDEGLAIFSKPNTKKSDQFYQVLYDNEGLAFFKDPKIILREGVKNGITDTADKFVKRSKYYVANDGEDPIAVNLKKRDLFDHFPEIEMVAINEILKKKKIKLKKEKDYLELFAQL